jgi:hypothetical protein
MPQDVQIDRLQVALALVDLDTAKDAAQTLPASARACAEGVAHSRSLAAGQELGGAPGPMLT